MNMEKRRSKLSKILSQFDALIDEKLTLEDNLKLLLDKLYPYVDYARKIENGGRKDLNEILKYELKILKKLTDLNTDLEGFIDNQSVSCIQGMKNDENTKSRVIKTGLGHELFEQSEVKSEREIPAQQQEPLNSEYSVSNEFTEEIHNPSTMIIPFEFSGLETNREYPENDIETLKNSLRHFSATLGLTPENFSNMEDYYEKPSSSGIKEEKITDNIKEVFEIPVKDTTEIKGDFFYNSENKTHTKPLLTKKQCDLKFSISERTENQESYSNTKQKNNSTALNKLDKYLSKKPNNAVVQTAQIPDISLKPTKACNILNSKPNTQPKRNKSDKASDNPSKGIPQRRGVREEEDLFYEPKLKMTPMVGDECAFSHIESPSEFYIHINDEETALIDSLTEQINEYFSGSVSPYRSKQMACNDVGKYCISYIPDYASWFRVEVLDWYLDDESLDVLVQLVDYGNKRRTSYRNLRKMIKEICDIPLLAIRCHFPVMFPHGSTPANKLTDWPEVAVEALVGLSTNNGQQNMFKIMFAQEESHSIAIDLLSPFEEERGNTVGQFLLDMGIAVQIFD